MRIIVFTPNETSRRTLLTQRNIREVVEAKKERKRGLTLFNHAFTGHLLVAVIRGMSSSMRDVGFKHSVPC